jgi:hypothetical protein
VVLPEDDGNVVPVNPLSISLTDLKITKNETRSSIEAYGKQMAAVLRPLGTPRPNEGELMLAILEKKDGEAYLKIYQASKVHFRILANMKEMVVPQSAAQLHFNIMKGLNLTAAELANMSKAEKDPALAITNGLKYQTEALNFFTAIAALNEYFAQKGIVFADDERITIYINVYEQ